MSIKRPERMEDVHPDLVKVVELAATRLPFDLLIVEGARSFHKQKKLVEIGASQTMKSRHLTGHAVDVAPQIGFQARWDWPLFRVIADAMKAAAKELGVPVEWGGDWVSFKDGPHFQLPWKKYPMEIK